MSTAFWDARYGEKSYAYGTQPNTYFKRFIDSQEPGKVLLPGEGEGRNAVYAASLDEFDAIGLIFFHLPASTRETVHRQFINSLKQGGYLLVEAFSKDQLGRTSGGPPSVELLYDRYLLNRDFASLEIMELLHTEEDLDEGPFHQGKAALVRMLARKL